ncbi:hypothetical protein QBC44DRAFT_361539 [Cladorrhinum sp. PSN332]|nr:hypothetical protein QBC44DRAFT_361539 [Cladorrhinum sp. PSN332]
MARKWQVDGDDSDRLPEGIEVEGYDADSRIYFYRSKIDGTHYQTHPGQKYGELIPISSSGDSPSQSSERPVEIRDSSGNKHIATPFRLQPSRAATFDDAFASRWQSQSWDNESRTVVDDDDDDDDDDNHRSSSDGGALCEKPSQASSGGGAGSLAKKVGKFARMVRKRIGGGSSSSPSGPASSPPFVEDGGQALSYDPNQPVLLSRRRTATTFDDMLSETPKKNARPIQHSFSMRQKRTTW